MVFGVFPVAVLGLAFYVVVTALMTPWAWRMQRRDVGLLRLVAMVAGMGFVMYLIYAEVVQIQDICEYCTGVHVITFLLFCITVFSAAIWGSASPPPKPPPLRRRQPEPPRRPADRPDDIVFILASASPGASVLLSRVSACTTSWITGRSTRS